MKVESIDPWGIRDRPNVLSNTAPRTRATFSLPPKFAMRAGWSLFWRAAWSFIRRRDSITFWLEDGS